jgi:putative tricarboxylic transport membrane protein
MDIAVTLSHLIDGFSIAAAGANLLYCLIGVTFGMLVGVLPGLGPTAGTALLLTLTYSLSPASAIIMLSGIYYGAMYGGTITSVLINTPGENSSVITCLDGYPLTKQGRAGVALGVSAIGSFFGGLFSLILLILVGPALSTYALKFGPPEFFCLIMMGLVLIISLLGKSIIKGLISALLGLMVSMVGIDPFNGALRYTFGSPELMAGIEFVAVSVGIFAMTEIFSNMTEDLTIKKEFPKIQSMFPRKDEWPYVAKAIGRGSVIGSLLGLVPGCNSAIPTVVGYSTEKRLSKRPELFGNGAIEGITVAETANNAFSGSTLIPMFTLGLPTSPTMAVLMSAFIMHGVAPGPTLMSEHPEVVWPVIASMFIGNVILVFMNLPLANAWAQISRIPSKYLFPSIVIISFLGVYCLNTSIFDIQVMIIAGIVAYFVKMADFPMIPFIITFILGDRIELTLGQSLTMFTGSLTPFFFRPICLVLIIAMAITIVFGVVRKTKIKETVGGEESEM